MTDRSYTPALGIRVLTPLYDVAIRTFTRERRWRSALIRQVAPAPGERILDIGCGTGTLTRALKLDQAAATIIGIDPDPAVLDRARASAARAGLDITYVQGFLDERFIRRHGPFDKIVSSLVLHQVPLAGKREILTLARVGLIPGGTLHVGDYGLQRTRPMRFLFRNIVQRLDGVEDTEPNARGRVPELMREAGFAEVEETGIVPTPTGSISLYRGLRRS